MRRAASCSCVCGSTPRGPSPSAPCTRRPPERVSASARRCTLRTCAPRAARRGARRPARRRRRREERGGRASFPGHAHAIVFAVLREHLDLHVLVFVHPSGAESSRRDVAAARRPLEDDRVLVDPSRRVDGVDENAFLARVLVVPDALTRLYRIGECVSDRDDNELLPSAGRPSASTSPRRCRVRSGRSAAPGRSSAAATCASRGGA